MSSGFPPAAWGASLQKPGSSEPWEKDVSGNLLPETSRAGDRRSGCFWGRAPLMLLIGVRMGVAIGGQGQALLPWTGSLVST